MDSQVTDTCRSAFYHIRAMRHIRPTITDDVASENDRLFVRYVWSRLHLTLRCMEFQRKTFIACSECRTPWRESFSVLRR